MRRVLIALTLLFFGCSGAELMARHFNPPRHVIKARDWLASHPLAYGNAKYVDELLHYNYGVECTAQDDGTWRAERDIRSKYFNIIDGQRHTAGNPEHYDHTIYMFGSSTLFSQELADADTMPSKLQALLPNYRVVNLSRPGAAIFSQTQFLKSLSLRSGDIVIFYSAVVDVTTLPYYTTINRGALCSLPITLLKGLCRYPLTDEEIAPHLEVLRQRYTTNLIEANDYAKQHGATFYNVVQPHIWTRSLSEYERYIVSISQHTPPEAEGTFIKAWPMIQAGATGVETLDLTHILDKRRAAGEIFFFDAWHLSISANETIARAIAAALAE